MSPKESLMSPEELLKLFEDHEIRYGKANVEIRKASDAMRFVSDEVKACDEIRLKGSTFPQMDVTFPLSDAAIPSTVQDFSTGSPEEPKNRLTGQAAREQHAARSQDTRTALLKDLSLPRPKVSR